MKYHSVISQKITFSDTERFSLLILSKGGDGMGVVIMGSDYNDFMMMVFVQEQQGGQLDLVATWLGGLLVAYQHF